MSKFTIEIDEETETDDDMADVLQRIAGLIHQGYTSGFDPEWRLVEKD
jgi:hypothetical protein